jgi:hypothetical protein
MKQYSLNSTVKIIIFLVILFLIGILGYCIGVSNSKNHNGNNIDTSPKVSTNLDTLNHTSIAETSLDPTTNWKTHTSKILNLSFKYPETSSYSEKDLDSSIRTAGHQVYFKDNNGYPNFEVTTLDFKAEDSIPHDLITGTLKTEDSFSIPLMEDNSTPIKTEVAPGIYHVTGFSNMECSPAVSSYLFVKGPDNSGIKYISFYLKGKDSDAVTISKDSGDPCTISDQKVAEEIKALDANTASTIEFKEALEIAKTFSVK